MRNLLIVLLVTVLMVVLATQAFAGVFDTVKGWMTGEVIAFIASAVAVVIAGAVGVLYTRITRTCKEAGEFLAALGTALEDKKITRQELGSIVKEGKDIFAVWGGGSG